MATKDDVRKLLAAGFPVPQVAEMLRLKEPFINALLKDNRFAAEVDAAITKRAMSTVDRDDKLDGLHDTVIGMLEDNLEYMTKPAQLLRAFSVINGAKKERDMQALKNGNGLGNGARVVNIILPSHLMVHAVHHEVNANNEVVIVEDKPMITMDSKSVAALVNKATEKLEEDLANSFQVNGRQFTLSDLDLFGEDKVGVLNQSLNNLDLLSKRREDAAKARRGETPVDIEEAEYYTEMIGTVIPESFKLPIGCLIFQADEWGETRDEEFWLQDLGKVAEADNIKSGKTKEVSYTSAASMAKDIPVEGIKSEDLPNE